MIYIYVYLIITSLVSINSIKVTMFDKIWAEHGRYLVITSGVLIYSININFILLLSVLNYSELYVSNYNCFSIDKFDKCQL